MAGNNFTVNDNAQSIFVIGGAATLIGGLLSLLLLTDVQGALIAITAILGMFYVVATVLNGKIGFYLFYTFTYWLFMINWYIAPTLPVGTAADALLLINVAVIMMRLQYEGRLDTKIFKSVTFIVWLVWLILTVGINFANFSNANFMSFLYGVRRLHLNPLGLTLMSTMVIQTKRDFIQFLHVTAAFVFISVLIAYRQKYIGFNSMETALLQGEFGSTHVLPGITRIWGPFAEAATYGISMSIYAVLAFVYGLTTQSPVRRFFAYVFILIAIHQILLSGTRTAYGSFGLAIIVIGLFYAKGTTRFGILSTGAVAFYFFRYTWLGEGFTLIRRVRSAFNPNDRSFLVRLENRELLSGWLDGHPFGGGIGATQFDRRFDPGSFLSNFPPDGLFVRFRAELGYVGEYLFYAVNIALIIYMVYKIRKANPRGENRIWLVGALAAFLAARLSDYAQLTSMQFPMVNLTFVLIILFDRVDHWEDREIITGEESAPFR